MKKIIFYLNNSYNNDIYVSHSYDETKSMIEMGYTTIHTTSLANISFDLIEYGYDIYIVRNDKSIHVYPGMPNKMNKDIRIQHNLLRLILAGFFDNDFND